MSKKNKKILFGVLGLVVAVVVLALLYINFRPQPKDAGGSKTITLTVVFADESTKEFTIKTNEDFLRGALEQENLIAGVDGVTADDSANQYWALYIGDDYSQTGVDTTPVNDGDSFKFVIESY